MDKDILNLVLLFLRIIIIKNSMRNDLLDMFELLQYEINIYRNEFEKYIDIHQMTSSHLMNKKGDFILL